MGDAAGEGAAAVAKALVATGAPELKHLNLYGNRISTDGYKALTEALKKPTVAAKLTYLNVSRGETEEGEAVAAREALKAVAVVRVQRICRQVRLRRQRLL